LSERDQELQELYQEKEDLSRLICKLYDERQQEVQVQIDLEKDKTMQQLSLNELYNEI